jgi:hypothetical protein
MTKSSIDKESFNELEKKYDKLKKEIKALKHGKSRLEVELAKELKEKFYYKTVGSNQVVCIQMMLDIMMNMPEAQQVMANSMNERKGNMRGCSTTIVKVQRYPRQFCK